MCFRQGAPPLPDFSKSALRNLEIYNVYDQPSKEPLTVNIKNCYAIQGNITFVITNEQITESVLFIGLFNGIGLDRFQAKMINRGKTYTLAASVSVEACKGTTFWGQFCDKKLLRLGCDLNPEQKQSSLIGRSEILCKNHLHWCHLPDSNPKLVFLDVEFMSEELIISASDITVGSQSISNNNTGNGVSSLMVYARNGAIPTESVFDYSTELTRYNLVIKTPKLGTWYFYIVPLIIGGSNGRIQVNQQELCYSLRWEVIGYTLKGNNDQESQIIQVQGTTFSSINFSPQPILGEESSDNPWIYILMEFPKSTCNRNIRIELESNTSMEYELYARFGGLPSLEVFDYYYANQSSNSNNGLSLFQLYESSTQRVKFVIVYAQEGKWSFALRKQNSMINIVSRTNISIAPESCSNNCFNYGQCKANELTSCSFCQCDVFHGRFDCGIEVVSKAEQKLQKALLIGSNAAALLPAICALWKTSYAEWVVFMASGTASAIYHACDIQLTCLLEYRTLQFLDFWLSFMAVTSIVVYLTPISEAMKRAILSVVWILTGILANNNATSSKNCWFVVTIGVACILLAWVLEILTKCNTFSTNFRRPIEPCSWFLKTLKKIYRQFIWGFVIAGFVALALSGLSWFLENSPNYWIWHSIWHICMFIAAAFFICSKLNVQNEEPPKPNVNNDMQVVPTSSPGNLVS